MLARLQMRASHRIMFELETLVIAINPFRNNLSVPRPFDTNIRARDERGYDRYHPML